MIREKQTGLTSRSEIKIVEDLTPEQEDLILGMFDLGLIKFGEFDWTYHKEFPMAPKAPMYTELRDVSGDYALNKRAVDVLEKKVEMIQFDKTAGVQTAIIPILTTLKDRGKQGFATLRKNAKGKGSNKMVDGFMSWDVGFTFLVVDDVLARGDSKIGPVSELEKVGGVVKDILCFMDYGIGGAKILEGRGYKFHSIWSVDQMLNTLVRKERIGVYTYLGVMGRLAEMRRFFKQVDSQEVLIF